jgi:hypothetical protein
LICGLFRTSPDGNVSGSAGVYSLILKGFKLKALSSRGGLLFSAAA